MHPWVQSQKGGADNQVRVALGTDSLASNPDLDVLQEVRFIHSQYPNISAAQLMHLVTRAGAEALGWGEETGSLRQGKSADLAVVPLSSAAVNDPFQLVLESPYRVQKVLFQGRWTHADAPTSRLKS
jgi:cytosine/adenosine deaminase-related metal-dependent hydrolase